MTNFKYLFTAIDGDKNIVKRTVSSDLCEFKKFANNRLTDNDIKAINTFVLMGEYRMSDSETELTYCVKIIKGNDLLTNWSIN